MAAFALGCISASAQLSLTLSTYNGTDISQYDGQTLKVTVSRYLFFGWNTISLPFDMSEEQVNEVFGIDCKLEKLVGVEKDGTGVKLNFQSCKSAGIQANVPYILHYTGENGSKKFVVESARIVDAEASITFNVQGSDETVTMGVARHQRKATGLYGILARDNAEATFVNVDETTNGFYATRCFIQMSNGNYIQLTTNHLTEAETTNINEIVKRGESVDVFNLSGVKVANSIEGLQKGIYVVKGKKVMVP